MINRSTIKLTQASILLAVALVFQMLGSKIPGINQYIVGSAVNAVLLLAAYLCGAFYGVSIAILTPISALLLGQLKPILAPFIPFIMIGNLILVVCFSLLCMKGVWGQYLGIITAAFLKFIFLYTSVAKLIYIFKINLPAPAVKSLSAAMGITQFFTALIGGIIAIALIRVLDNKLKASN